MSEIYNKNIIYKLEDGESLESVCKDFKVNINHIKKINNINFCESGDYIFLDQTQLNIHIVKPNETLSDIAKIYGTTEEEIKKKNNIEKTFLGQQLII